MMRKNDSCESSSDDEGYGLRDYQVLRRETKLMLFKKSFYYVTDKRTQHCGENSTGIVQKKIEDNASETSGGVKVDIEDKTIPLVEPPLESPELGHAAQCSCPNCDDVLSRFAECSICLEPLQCRGPCVCPVCGGMWCDRCSRRMSRCAWCRTSLRAPAAPCVALQRLVSELMLPCRNYRRGCTDLLTASNRVSHEEKCKHDGMSCPISATCSTVPFDEISSHLQSKHNVIAVYSQKIRILIENFESKLKKTASCRTKYKIVLLHDKSAFIIKVSIYNYHVKVEIMRRRLGYTAAKCETKKSEYCALVEFQSKKVSLKSALLIENGAYSKKAEAQWTDTILESDSDESITIHVAITQSDNQIVVSKDIGI